MIDRILSALGLKRSRTLFNRHFEPADHPLRATLDARYEALRKAMTESDPIAIAAILTPDFQSVDVRGNATTSNKMIDSVLALKIDRSKRTATTTLVSIVERDGAAIVIQHYRMVSAADAPKSMPRELQSLSRDTWEKRHGEWLCKRTETLELELRTSDGVHKYQKARDYQPQFEDSSPKSRNGMDEDRFWELIEASKPQDGSIDAQVENLTASLTKLPNPEIVEFARLFDKNMACSYAWDLWAAAFIIKGGCSDDGFDDFRGWLISKGRNIFEAALRDPESLIDVADPDAEAEAMLYVASAAFERKNGAALPDFRQTVPAQPSGARWDEETVGEKCPRLAARFSA